MNVFKKNKIWQRGFTLIELVIVIVIIGILAAVAIPRFKDLSGDATTSAEAATIAAIQSGYAIAAATTPTVAVAAQEFEDALTNCDVTGPASGVFTVTCGGTGATRVGGSIFSYTVSTGAVVKTGTVPAPA